MHYHVSRSVQQIKEFRPFTHFGVAQAALDRAQSPAFARAGADEPLVYEVELLLDPAFVLRVPDLTDAIRQNTHSLKTLADMLHYDIAVISAAAREKAFAAATSAPHELQEEYGLCVLALAVKDLGYEGLVYANSFEAKGQDSIMILHPDQARIVRTMSIHELKSIAVDLAGVYQPQRRSAISLSFW